MKRIRAFVMLSAIGVAGALSSGAGMLVAGSPQDPQPDALTQALADRLAAVRKFEEFVAARRESGLVQRGSLGIQGGGAELEFEVLWSRRLAEAAVQAGRATHRAAFEAHRDRVRQALRESQVLFEAGRESISMLTALRYHEADARVLLERGPQK